MPQPSGDLRAVEAHFAASRGGQSFREDLGQCLSFEIQLRLSVDKLRSCVAESAGAAFYSAPSVRQRAALADIYEADTAPQTA